MIINVDYKTYDNKLYVVTKPMHEILNKPAFVPNIDVDEVLGILHIRYAYGSDWIWKKDDEYHIGYELEPRYWNKDYDHILSIVTGKQIGRASCRERVCLYV